MAHSLILQSLVFQESSGRYYDAMSTLCTLIGDQLTVNPVPCIEHFVADGDPYNVMQLAAEALFHTEKYRAACLVYSELRNRSTQNSGQKSEDTPSPTLRMVECHYHLGEYEKGSEILDSITFKSAQWFHLRGLLNYKQGDLKAAEENILIALQYDWRLEELEDYYGDRMPCDHSNIMDTKLYKMSPEQRLSRIHSTDVNSNTIIFVKSLGLVYEETADYILAEAYIHKALEMSLTLYGSTAAVYPIADCLQSLGDINSRKKQYSEADECYRHALNIYREIQGEKVKTFATAKCLRQLGENYVRMEQFCDAAARLREALTIYQDVTQGGDTKQISDILARLDEIENSQKRLSNHEKNSDESKSAGACITLVSGENFQYLLVKIWISIIAFYPLLYCSHQ